MELIIPLDPQGKKPLYEQIYRHIKTEIRNGNLKPQMRLPSTRRLAENLKVSRSTTQLAYEQLVSEGYLEAVPRKGYFPARLEGLVAPVETKGADPAEPVRCKPDENSRVGWFGLEEAVAASTEPWFRERIYKKLNEKLAGFPAGR